MSPVEEYLKLPRHLIIENSSRCNYLCPLCLWTKNHHHGHLQPETFSRFISQTKDHLDWLCFSGRGEPTLSPHLYECIRLCREAGVSVNLSTNGSNLLRDVNAILDSGVNYVTVSIESDDPEEYEIYRVNGKYRQVAAGMKALADEKRRRQCSAPLLCTCTVLFNYNENRVEELKARFSELGFERFIFKSAHLGHGQLNESLETLVERWLPKNSEKRRSKYLPERGDEMCGFLNQAHLLWNGDIARCAIDQQEMIIGNILETPFSELWLGKRSRAIVERIISRSFPKCRDCAFSGRKKTDSSPELYLI